MIRTHLLLLLLCGSVWAQKADTLLHRNLDEVTVSYALPLANNDVVGFYKTNRFASIDDISARLPGMALVRRGAYAMEPQLGGFSGGQVNVTIDGMHIFGACTDKMDPVTSYIETDNLQAINLNFGTNGSKYGNTVGGALDMELLKPTFTPHNTSLVTAGYGYETVSDGHNANLLWHFSDKRWAFTGNASYRKHGTYTDGDGKNIAFSQYQKFNLFGSAVYSINTTSFLQASAIYDKATDVGYPALPMDVATAEGQIYSLSYHLKQWKKLRNIQGKLYYNTIYHLMDDSERDSLFYINNGTDSVYMRMDMPGWSQTTGAFAEAEYRIDRKSKLLLKVEHYTNTLRADMTMFMTNASNPNEPPMFTQTWPKTSRGVTGVYAAYDRYFGSSLKLTASVRADYSQTRMLSATGRQQFSIFEVPVKSRYHKVLANSNVGLKYHLSPHWQSDIGLGYGQRLPTLSEQFGFYLFNAQDGYDYVGNPNIKPEQAWQINWLVSYQKSKIKSRFYTQYSRVSDFIYGHYRNDIPQMNLYAQGTKQYINLPHAIIWTNTAEIIYKPLPKLTYMSVNTFTYGYKAKDNTEQNSDSHRALPQISPFKSTNMLQWQTHQFRLVGEVIYTAQQKRIDTNYGETTSSSHLLFNARIQFQPTIDKQQIVLQAGLNNITNALYKEHLDWGPFNRPGRNLTFQIYYNF